MLKTVAIKSKKYHLLGTAHISQQSVDEVEKYITEIKPDAVCIEICETRYKNLSDGNRWREMDIIKVIKEKKSGLLLASLLLSAFQRKMGKQLGIKPGAEMMKAVEICQTKKIPFFLIDREVNITIQRTWNSLSLWEKIKLMGQLVGSIVFTPKIDEKEIEKMKEKDLLSGMIEELSQHFPRVKQILIDERDQYLATKMVRVAGKNILAVIGIGHQSGMEQSLLKGVENINLQELEKIPPKKKWLARIFQWGIPLLILSIFGYGFFKLDSSTSLQLVWSWVLVNSIPAFLGAWIAGGHWWTRICALFVAPFTSINPVLAAGWVAGFTEALIQKPKVRDFENLSEEILSWKGLRGNSVSRILLVIALTNLGSTIGTFVGIPLLASFLN